MAPQREATLIRVADTASPTGPARYPHLDNLRTVLVGWVIGGHALLGYMAVGGWSYDEVNEVTFAPPSELVLVVILGPSSLFVMGMFFFVAGLLTESAVERHGWREYVRGRALRLGLPWLASALLVWPVSVWFAYRAAGRPVTVWWVFTHRQPLLDSGSMWFALVLVVFSVVFAVGHAVSRRVTGRRIDRVRRPLTAIHLAVTVLAIAACSFVVRLWFPARSGQIGDLHLWMWPQCAGQFALGIVAGRRGWARHVPDRLRRGCGVVTLVTLVVLPVFAFAVGLRNVARDAGPYLGGLHWESVATAAVEAILVVAGSVWLVGGAERRLDGTGPRSDGWSRVAFAAFVIQGPVLMSLATAGRVLAVPAEVKAPLVAASAIAVSFWLGRLLPLRSTSSDRAIPEPQHRRDESRTIGLGTEVHYVDFGGTSEGPTVVLVHGLGGSHLNWDLLAPKLTRVARVHALDLPGFGLSTPTGRPATVRSNVDALAEFVTRACVPPVVLVGNSMGGLVSVLLASRRPDLVRGLVLLDPALPAPRRIAQSPATAVTLAVHALPGVGERLRRARRHRIGARATMRETLQRSGVDESVLPTSLVERQEMLVARQSDVAGMDRAYLSAARSLAWALVRARRYHAAMASISVPVLLIHGEEDELVPVTAARATARRHARWQYVELSGVGHTPQLQVPDTVAAHVIDWLAGLPSDSVHEFPN